MYTRCGYKWIEIDFVNCVNDNKHITVSLSVINHLSNEVVSLFERLMLLILTVKVFIYYRHP